MSRHCTNCQERGYSYRVITTRAEYRAYLAADRATLSRSDLFAWLTNDVWRYQRALRRTEYRINTRHPLRYIAQFRLRRLGQKLGFSIPPNVFGPGLSIAHYGTIVVNSGARIGANCRVHVDVNIGTTAGEEYSAPNLGDNCYLAPGAKLFGPIIIGDNTAVGANAVVNKSFPDGNATLGGIPATVISSKPSIQAQAVQN